MARDFFGFGGFGGYGGFGKFGWFGKGGKKSDIELSLVGTFDSGLGEDSSEILAHDPDSQRLFVTNSGTDTVDIIDFSDPAQMTRIGSIDVSMINGETTGGPNSVAVANGIVAIAVEADDQTDPGLVAFYDADGNFLGSVEVGPLPDMLTFTPDGQKILVANEGEPDGGVDPKGSVSIIDLSGGIGAATVQTAGFTAFDAQQADLEAAGLRIFEGKVLSDDVEPEYIAISEDGTTAFITLQEANAVAVLDIASATITEIQPLGAKDHSQPGNGLDPSDRDGGINIDEVPVFGLYMPDAIASYESNGKTYYVTANEGDARDEDDRVGDLALDPTAFPNAAELQQDENLGRLEVSTIDGDTDGDGDYDQLFAYGARSFSIWDEDGNLVFDSGDMIAQITAELTPELFNANDGDPGEFDARSDAKGAEPESVVVGEVDGHTYAFVGLERAGGGVMVFDITDPKKVEFVQYIRTDGDIAPEGLAFISAEDSPIDVPLLAVSNEVSGTTSVYEISFDGEKIFGRRTDDLLEGTAGDDRILGFGGDDDMFGFGGDDDMRGGRGDDDAYGGFGDDNIKGEKGDDNLFGEGGNDYLDGGRGDDHMEGGDGDDRSKGGRGDDHHDGGEGTDTAVFSGKRANYEIDFDNGTVTDLRGRWWDDGTDTFVNIEFLEFRDETVEVPGTTEPAFTLQILHASDLEGGVDAIGRAPNFAAIVDTLEDEYENTVLISAGDNYIPGPLFNAAGDGGTFNPLFEGFYNQYFGLIDVSLVDLAADTDGNGFFSNDELDAFILANPGINASDIYVVDINGDGTPDYFDEIDNSEGRVDISIMNILGFDATAVGNHEFDNGSDAFENIVNYDSEEGNSLSSIDEQSILDEFGPDAVNYLQEVDWPGAQFPYLSANLDFSGDGDIGSLFTPEILANTAFLSDLLSARDNPADPTQTASDSNDSKIAPATIIEENGEYIGVVGATTQLLESLSSPTGTSVVGGPFTANDMQQLADVLQPIIDDLTAGDAANGRPPVNKIILTSHLQQIELETELAGLLSGIDVIIAGGSDTLLADETDRLRPGDTADDTYPVLAQDADGNPVAIVSTDGEYSYVGRLVIEFDADGNIIPESIDADVSGAYATDDQSVLDVTGAGDVDAAIAESEKATDVKKLTDAAQQVVTERDGNVFGETDVFIDGVRGSVRTEETNMGNLTADANLAQAQSIDDTVLVSLKNGGGIRAPIGEVDAQGNELPPQENPLSGKEEGEVSQLDIENTLRFNNGLVLVTLTPEQLLEVLEHAVSATGPGATPGQFAQVGGLSFSFDPDQPAGDRVQSVALVDESGNKTTVVENGEVAAGAPDAIRIVTLDFLENGGDGYPYPDFRAADEAFYDRVFLEDIDPTTVPGALDGNADFAAFGSEQDALAEFLAENHPVADGSPDGPSDFMAAETPPEEDERVQNLSVRDDTVLEGGSGPAGIVINEVRTDQTSTDNDEYFELFGEPGASLDGLTYIVIGDGTGGSGVIENVTDLSGFSLDANGFFTVAEGTFGLGTADLTTTLAFENNDNVTHLLVRDFTGAVGDDLDTNDDGTPETAPWSEVLDSVAIIDEVGGGDLVYSTTQVGPNGSFAPGHIFRLPDGTGDWQIGEFDPAAGSDTPGEANSDVGTGPLALAIYEIQGAGHRSPHEGALVATAGIVTAIDSGGFYIQDAAGDGDIATSDGIYVLADTTGIAVGDEVAVEGSVEEQQFGADLSLTRIVASSTTVNSSGNAVPDAVVLGVDRVQPDDVIDDDGLTSFDPADDAIDFLESLEGMLVEVNDPLAVAGTNRFDEVALIANRGGESGSGILNAVISDGDFNPEILLANDSIVTEPNVTTGDRFDGNPVGVIDYSFGAYKLELTETPSVISGGRTPETTSLAGDDTHMTIATYNAFNLDPSDGTPGGGADQLDALAQSIVNNLGSPDVIALQEIQDNTGTTDDGVVDANLTLQELTQAIFLAGGPLYTFAQINPGDNEDGGAPGSNIRNAILYNAERVELDPASLQRIEDSAFNEDGDGTPAQEAYEGTRKPLVAEFTFLATGETVTVIANHLKSKTQDDALFGENQPPVQNTLDQRVDQAEAVNQFVADLLATDPDANVIVLGDMNDFQFSDTLAAMANGNGGDAELINLIDSLPTEDQYTFIFNGNSQVLDHILVTTGINDRGADVDIVHTNLDFGFPSDNPSDHDPVVARVDLSDDMAMA